MDKLEQPKPTVRFEIARSLNGNKIVYIARDSGGVVRLRAENLETLEKMIFEYRPYEPPKPKIKPDNEKIVDEKIEELVDTIVAAQSEEEVKKPVKKSAPRGTPEEVEAIGEQATTQKKEFLKNELKETIEEQKDKTEKKSFWDKLR